jgi:hypothetical protein
MIRRRRVRCCGAEPVYLSVQEQVPTCCTHRFALQDAASQALRRTIRHHQRSTCPAVVAIVPAVVENPLGATEDLLDTNNTWFLTRASMPIHLPGQSKKNAARRRQAFPITSSALAISLAMSRDRNELGTNLMSSPWQGDGRAVKYPCGDAIFLDLARNLLPGGPASSRRFPSAPVAVTHCVTHWHDDRIMRTSANTILHQDACEPGSLIFLPAIRPSLPSSRWQQLGNAWRARLHRQNDHAVEIGSPTRSRFTHHALALYSATWAGGLRVPRLGWQARSHR